MAQVVVIANHVNIVKSPLIFTFSYIFSYYQFPHQISNIQLHKEISHEEYISITNKDKIREPFDKEIDFCDVTFACEGKQIMAPKEMFGYSEVKKEIEDSVFDNSVPVTVNDHFENNNSAMIFYLKMHSFSAMKVDNIQVRDEYNIVPLEEENVHFENEKKAKIYIQVRDEYKFGNPNLLMKNQNKTFQVF